MYLYERIFHAIRRRTRPKPPRNFALARDTLRAIRRIASQERRSPEEVANQMLVEAINERQALERKWQSLTPREQEVTELICLNYTIRRIAETLTITPNTVKTHVKHILTKFAAPDGKKLRVMLRNWDFREREQ